VIALSDLHSSPVLNTLAAEFSGLTDDDPQAALWIAHVVLSLTYFPHANKQTEHENDAARPVQARAADVVDVVVVVVDVNHHHGGATTITTRGGRRLSVLKSRAILRCFDLG
jgi:hypothetical protein